MRAFINPGHSREVIFTRNATEAINLVAASWGRTFLEAGDEIVISEMEHHANFVPWQVLRDEKGIVMRQAPIGDDGEFLMDAFAKLLGPKTKLVAITQMSNVLGTVLPVADIARMAHDAGAKVLIDGAHAPGTLPLDIPALGADWYAANLHKWYFAPRGCGLLWAAEAAQQDLHPAAISWRLDEGYTAEFDWNGTRDPSPFLCFPDGVTFMDALGAERVRSYNHDLVVNGAGLLFERYGPDLALPEAMTGAMALAPLPVALPAAATQAQAVRDALWFQHGIEVPVVSWGGRLWARTAAQVYCDMADFERLAEAVATIRVN